MTEKDIENAILAWLSYQPNCFAWKNQTVGVFDPKRRVFRKSWNKFHIKGVSDILGIWHGKFLAIEVKMKGKNPTPDQVKYIEKVKALGGIAFVARSVDDVKNQLTPIL